MLYFIFVNLNSQISEKNILFQSVLLKLNFLMLIFNCLIMAFQKPKHVASHKQ